MTPCNGCGIFHPRDVACFIVGQTARATRDRAIVTPRTLTDKIAPHKRLKNWHRAHNAVSTTRYSLKVYARLLAAGDGPMSRPAKAWIANK